MRAALGLSDNQMAILQGPALAIPLVLAAIPLGLLVDRYSRVRLLFVFMACNLIGGLLTAFAPNFTALFVARCLVGLAVNATTIAAFSLLADFYPPAQRGRANMVVAVGQAGGIAAAFAVGGALATMSAMESGGWRWAMAWLASPLLAVTILMLILREPLRTGITCAQPFGWQALQRLWRHRGPIAPVFGGLILAEVTIGAALVWATPALARHFELAPDRVGALMSIVVLGSVLGSIAGGIVADICHRTGGPRRTVAMLTGLALLNVLASFFAIAPNVVSASMMLFTLMTIFSAIVVSAFALVTIIVPSEVRGLCLAVVIGTNTLFAVALAPVAVSMLSGSMGGPAMIGKALTVVCVTASLLGVVAFSLGIRIFPRSAAYS
jgi:MFS family permease